MTDRAAVADSLEEIGLLLELLGENPFKTRAYANAARVLRGLDTDLGELVRTRRLGDLKGFGPALVEKISTLVRTGELSYLTGLRKQVPPGLLEWLAIPGLGPKKARMLHLTLGIATLDELEAAAKAGKLRTIDGFGPASEKKILDGIARVRAHSGASSPASPRSAGSGRRRSPDPSAVAPRPRRTSTSSSLRRTARR
jgi:DNA polymerase (family 10)